MRELTTTEATELIRTVSNLVWARQPVGIDICAAPCVNDAVGFDGVLFQYSVWQGDCVSDVLCVAVSFRMMEAVDWDAYMIADWVCDKIKLKLSGKD